MILNWTIQGLYNQGKNIETIAKDAANGLMIVKQSYNGMSEYHKILKLE